MSHNIDVIFPPPHWVLHPLSDADVVAYVSIHINAPSDQVMKIIKDVSLYDELSNGLIRSTVQNNVLSKGVPIDFWIWFGTTFGTIHSREIVYQMSDDTLSWIKRVGLSPFLPSDYRQCNEAQISCHYSQRWQVVTTKSSKSCVYSTALKIPGLVGYMSSLFFRSYIQTAFDAMAQGIKSKAEKEAQVETIKQN